MQISLNQFFVLFSITECKLTFGFGASLSRPVRLDLCPTNYTELRDKDSAPKILRMFIRPPANFRQSFAYFSANLCELFSPKSRFFLKGPEGVKCELGFAFFCTGKMGFRSLGLGFESEKKSQNRNGIGVWLAYQWDQDTG